MTFEEKILNGFIIETVNPETGEVQCWELKNGKKITHKHMIAALEMLGWNYGSPIFLKEEGALTKVYAVSRAWASAIICTDLAETFRLDKFAKFIKD
jgi:hypothetical protein